MNGKRKGKYEKPRRHGIRWIAAGALVIALTAALAQGGNLLGKYTAQHTENEAVEAAAFYFNSNLLTESGSASYTYPAGATSISFTLFNYEDALRYSECNVSYIVTLTDGGSVTKTLSDATVEDAGGGTTAYLTQDQQSTHTITFTGLDPGTYTVTAVSSPYNVTLSASFTLQATSSAVSVTAVDEGANVKVTVAVSAAGDVTLTWPGALTPDTTDPIWGSATISGNSAVIYFPADSSYTFNFLKPSTATTYTENNFTAVYKS